MIVWHVIEDGLTRLQAIAEAKRLRQVLGARARIFKNGKKYQAQILHDCQGFPCGCRSWDDA